jgi:hypothetical protein
MAKGPVTYVARAGSGSVRFSVADRYESKFPVGELQIIRVGRRQRFPTRQPIVGCLFPTIPHGYGLLYLAYGGWDPLRLMPRGSYLDQGPRLCPRASLVSQVVVSA